MPVLTLLQTKISTKLHFETGSCVLNLLNHRDIQISSACAGHGFCGLCRIKVLNGDCSKLTCIEQNRLSSLQIQQGIRLACQVKALTDLTVAVENPVNVLAWKKLYPVNKTLINTQDYYGIAIDLGTTHLRLSLWNLDKQQRVLAWRAVNPQFRFGADVLTRLMAAQSSASDALELSLLIKQAVKNALQIITRLPLNLAQLRRIFLVGNTPMLTLFSHKNFLQLLDPDYWTQAVDCQIENLSDWQNFLDLTSQTVITNIPPLAGFVGSDLLAAVLATELTGTNECTLLIDFGTNSELALWDGKSLWISSVPGGPAFEGAGISCGMPAGTGAIYQMVKTFEHWDYQMLGHGKPLGLCGSALVDVIAQLLKGGQLSRNGRFKNHVNSEYELPLNSNETLIIKKQDIDIFQRAKAATGAAQVQLLKQAGVTVERLSRVYVCGAFGRFLNIANAQTIGLLPPIPTEKIQLYENAALHGCELMLTDSENLQALERIRANAQIINMAYAVNFDECFVENLYLQPIAFAE